MKKRALPALALCLCLLTSGVGAQTAENTEPKVASADVVALQEEQESGHLQPEAGETPEPVITENPAKEDAEQVASPSVLPEQLALSFSVFPETVYLEEKLMVTATVHYTGEETSCSAVWMFNGSPIPGFSNHNFLLTDSKTSTLSWNITEEWRGWGSMEVSFKLFAGDKELTVLSQSFTIEDMTREEAEKKSILEIVQPVRVEGSIRYNTTLYSDVMLTRKIGTVSGGTTCQILNSKSGYSNQVLLSDGRRGWVSLNSLFVSQKNYTKETDISNKEKDLFVNTMAYKSKTDYLVWVHLECQKVNVFLKKGGRWCIEEVFPCASGKNVTPTINGVFTYTARNNRWEYEKYYVGPALIFHGNYALHSVLLRYDGSVYDGTVGKPASNGCVRMNVEDINWMSDFVPFGTTVVVY